MRANQTFAVSSTVLEFMRSIMRRAKSAKEKHSVNQPVDSCDKSYKSFNAFALGRFATISGVSKGLQGNSKTFTSDVNCTIVFRMFPPIFCLNWLKSVSSTLCPVSASRQSRSRAAEH